LGELQYAYLHKEHLHTADTTSNSTTRENKGTGKGVQQLLAQDPCRIELILPQWHELSTQMEIMRAGQAKIQKTIGEMKKLKAEASAKKLDEDVKLIQDLLQELGELEDEMATLEVCFETFNKVADQEEDCVTTATKVKQAPPPTQLDFMQTHCQAIELADRHLTGWKTVLPRVRGHCA
jgi:hypothetical protein